MEFIGPIIFVKDILASRNLYERLLNQQLAVDAEDFQQFQSGLILQSIIKDGFPDASPVGRNCNSILYFETDDFDRFYESLMTYMARVSFQDGTNPKTRDWGQRFIRFYDSDSYLIEVSESLRSVTKRIG